MGFPVGYSELLLPKQLLHLLLLLGHIRRCLLWAFHAVGLGDLLDLADDTQHHHHLALQEHANEHTPQPQHWRSEFRAVPAMLVDEALPVVRFDELDASSSSCAVDCAVCLSGIGSGDEVRRLSNCRHVFHRGCLDRWMDHDQRTCPLCRAPLIPDEMDGAGAVWAQAAGLPDASDFDFFYFGGGTLAASMSSPTTLLRPHELLISGLGGYQ